MTERGLPLADGASACPFVAFEDDRDERASVPDHRHRCYADSRPAPRALAHQEAYCLSSAFPVCPTFQDWARREAARARGGAPSAPSASAGMNRAATGAAADAASDAASDAPSGNAADAAAAPGSGGAWAGTLAVDEAGGVVGAAGTAAAAGATAAAGADAADHPGDRWDDADDDDAGSRSDRDDPAADDLVRRNPPRDWSAPPPWLASDERRRDVNASPPPFLGHRAGDPGQGLAGSSADRVAGGPPPNDDPGDAVWSGDSRSAAAVGAGNAAERPAGRRPQPHDEEPEEFDQEGRRTARRPRAYAQHLGGPDGPDWERPRRYEAYPEIKSRVAMPAIPRVVALAGLVAVLALALFFIVPGLLNLGGTGPGPGASTRPSANAGSSASLAPTAPPAPTPTVYTIKHGDTLLKIAKAHGITIEELMAANPTIKNPNKISEGQQITIPAPGASAPDTIGGSAAP